MATYQQGIDLGLMVSQEKVLVESCYDHLIEVFLARLRETRAVELRAMAQIWRWAITTKQSRCIEAILQVTSEKRIDLPDNAPNIFVSAALNNEIIILREFIRRGMNVNVTNDNESTALLAAVMFGNWECVEILLENGANPNLAPKDHETALQTAIRLSTWDNINMLMRYGANPNAVDAQGRNCAFSVVPFNILTLRGLIAAGMNVHVQDQAGDTPLMFAVLAAEMGEAEGLVELIAQGCDIHAKNEIGLTVLHYAAECRSTTAIEILLSAGANLHEEDAGGNSPLMSATREADNGRVIELLLSKGAKVDHKNRYHETPYTIALQLERGANMKQLLRWGADVCHWPLDSPFMSSEWISGDKIFPIARYIFVALGKELNEHDERVCAIRINNIELYEALEWYSEVHKIKMYKQLSMFDIFFYGAHCLINHVKKESFKTAIEAAYVVMPDAKMFVDDLIEKAKVRRAAREAQEMVITEAFKNTKVGEVEPIVRRIAEYCVVDHNAIFENDR